MTEPEDCHHTEHAKRGRHIVGRWFPDMNREPQGSWEVCPVQDALEQQWWDAFMVDRVLHVIQEEP